MICENVQSKIYVQVEKDFQAFNIFEILKITKEAFIILAHF